MMLEKIDNIQISDYNKFELTKNFDYSEKSLQRYLFKNINIKTDDKVSFHRADFRGSNILYSSFVGVDFSRCDFIAMNIEHTMFSYSSFQGCTFLNNILEHVTFEKNTMISLDFCRTSLNKCTFKNEHFSDCNWTDLIFDDCEFDDFEIEKSTLRNIKFKNCSLHNLNLARLTAVNLTFENCNLDNIVFDPDYLGSYCFDKSSLGNISYLYKEQIFKFDINNIDNIRDYANFLLQSQRYAEFFGFSAMLTIKEDKELDSDKLIDIWINCFNESLSKLQNEYSISDNIELLATSLKFYISKKLFSLSDILKALQKLSFIKEQEMSALVEEQVLYISTYLKGYIEQGKYSYQELESSNKMNNFVYAKFTLETDSFLEAEKIIDRIFTNLLFQKENSYYIVDSKKGSIILMIFSALISILGIIKLMSSIHSQVCNLIINHKKWKNISLLEEKKRQVIANFDSNNKHTLKELIQQNPGLIEVNKKDLQSISDLEIYLNERF